MTTFNVFALVPLIVFAVYWVGSAAYEASSGKSKETLATQGYGSDIAQRLCLWLAWILVLIGFQQSVYFIGFRILPNSLYLSYSGLFVSLLGIGFAIWARLHLGSNWSSTVSLKEGQTLITNGPYSIVRHPIYTGITLAIIGGAISVGDVGGLVAIILAIVFSLMRISKENALMKKTFGEKYDDYSKHVSAYIPGIW
jgi:protein-S-isoprenylcysteine O-methyltransferase Ste14